METEVNNDWQKNTVELMKTLHGYENPVYNPEAKYIELETTEDDQTKIMRVMINENAEPRPIYVKTLENTLETIQEKDIDQVLLLGERTTQASREIIKENDEIQCLTPNIKTHYKVSELIYSIQEKTLELCRQKCGKAPKKESDCTGYQNGEYSCQIRRLSDDATFHAEMKWNDILKQDWKAILDLEKELTQ
jgi:hypothetical protein